MEKKNFFYLVCVLFFILGLLSEKNIFADEKIKIKVGDKLFSVIEKNDKIFVPTEDLFKEFGFACVSINIDKDATDKDIAHKIFGDDVIKVRSCILLIASVCDIPVFKQLKSKYRW